MKGYAGVEIPIELQPKFDDGTLALRQGKVRDIIEAEDQIVVITTDRISAFDVVMPTLIPGRGQVLSRVSGFWLNFFSDVPNDRADRLSSDEFWRLQDALLRGEPEYLSITFCQKMDMLPIEFVVRGYVAGSFWKEYKKEWLKSNDSHAEEWLISPEVHGIFFDKLLKECERIKYYDGPTTNYLLVTKPIFTPATKAEQGEHDENIDFATAVEICSKHLNWSLSAAKELMETLKEVSCDMYRRAHKHALMRGIIIADTKFEFGMRDGRFYLCDEVLTPDSSRFWSLADYETGRDQDSYDKQILRNYLQELVDKGEWDKTSPGPELPDEIVKRIIDRYNEIYVRLTE